jgi:hypothetical protein
MQDRTVPALTGQESADLGKLRTRWLGIYHVALIDGVWRAKRYSDVTNVITADTAAELGELMTADYKTLARLP